MLARREGRQHVIITGRDAAPELIEAADLVMETTKVKHPMDAGQKGQRGIEFLSRQVNGLSPGAAVRASSRASFRRPPAATPASWRPAGAVAPWSTVGRGRRGGPAADGRRR